MVETGELYIGIDVACAKGKRIPTVIVRRTVGDLSLLPLKDLDLHQPRCTGNAKIAKCVNEVDRISTEYADWLEGLQLRFNSKICRVVIDAPSQPRLEESEMRDCEAAIQKAGMRFFQTPSLARLEMFRQEAIRHLKDEKSESSLPGANLWWMLVGFELFKTLRARGFVCVESYPQAILKSLGYCGAHKSSAALAQFNAFRSTSNLGDIDESMLRSACHGSMHDKVDALMCAWLASLPDEAVQFYGERLDDQICIPKQRT